jgi:hypothetical protein
MSWTFDHHLSGSSLARAYGKLSQMPVELSLTNCKPCKIALVEMFFLTELDFDTQYSTQ